MDENKPYIINCIKIVPPVLGSRAMDRTQTDKNTLLDTEDFKTYVKACLR